MVAVSNFQVLCSTFFFEQVAARFVSKRRTRRSGYQITTHMAAAFLLLILFVSSAYFFVLSGSNRAGAQKELLAELQTNQQLWYQKRPPIFEYVVARQCDCAQELRTPYKVRDDGTSRRAWYAIEIESATGDILATPATPVWLDDLYDIAEDAVLQDYRVRMSFDRRYGYLASLSILSEDSGEERYVIRDFEVDSKL